MSTPTLTKHTLPGALGPLLVDVRSGNHSNRQPAVLIVHGFKGFKDWGMFPVLAERVARGGFSAVSVNLSGSGVDDAGDFTLPERFGHDTFTAEVADVRTMFDALAAGQLGMPPAASIGVVGHSRGGGVAILAAAGDRRVHALVTWAAISHVNRWPGQAVKWRAAGKLDIVNARTGQVLPLYTDVLDDIESHQAALDIQAAAGRLSIPWLLIHGAKDESVPIAEAEVLARAASPATPPRVVTLPGTGHTFGAVHPFAGMTPELATAFDETIIWLARHL
jgi:pimeloyl-ACP methyl ester carboxylesterase